MVRGFLQGRFENTAFCILAPDGKTRLTKTGRSPQMALTTGKASGPSGPSGPSGYGRRLSRAADNFNNQDVIDSLEKIAQEYPAKGSTANAIPQDFHSFEQALNVSSGDQRLLVFTVVSAQHRNTTIRHLTSTINDRSISGRFHFDFAVNSDANWALSIKGVTQKTGIFIIHADPFGQSGKVIKQLPLNTPADSIKQALIKANSHFAKVEKPKVYSEHISAGRRAGIRYQDNMPWGEDRDADGKIDEPRRRH